ncbi:MAG: cysteine synthase family protein [Ktedonobacteraceae bacterium]
MNIPTPLVALKYFDANLYAKIEYLHPSGSMKHRSIPPFLREILASGEIRPGQRIAIRSAGSAAVTTAWAGAQLGLSVLTIVPLTVTQHTLQMLRWLGASIEQLPPEQATLRISELEREPSVYVLAQAREPRLIEHYRPVAHEIYEAVRNVTAITVGIGTGLSIMGIAYEMQELSPGCQVIGVEPAEAAIASGQPWAPHHIPGLAPPLAQPLLNTTLLGGLLPIPSPDAWHFAREVARSAGLPIGPSAGATLAAALRLRRQGVTGSIVAVCACSINDYLEEAALFV